ncbi:hypothetical protein WJX72_005904 [[Myrmecia] bisecta]|uniref:Uncharacterized protein n=1 Tax=[Myrmecia] bisecta TaxID=41462 RepID=A0AAW1PUI7_9CHLO
MDAPAPEPGTGERLSADFLPRPQTTESYMDRKLRTLQQAEWTAQDGALKPHKSKLMLEKEAVLSARVDELSDADKALCRRMVQQAIQKAIITEGKGLDETIIIHKSRLEREKEAAAALRKAGRPTSARKRPVPGASSAPGQGLGAVMTKPTSKLQREGDAAAASRAAQGKAVPSYMRSTAASAGIKQPGLGETLVKHQSKLEKEKEAARAAAMPGTATPAAAPKRPRLSSGFAGSSLGDMKVHKSRLEKDKENAVKQAGAAGLAPAATKVTAKTPARTAAAAAAQEPGLSAMKVHKSRVEREKEAWARAAARNAPAAAKAAAPNSAAKAGGRTLAAPVSAADFLKSAGKPRRTSLDRTGSGGKPLERSSSAGRRASGAGATCSQGPHTPLTAEQMQPV